MAKYLLDTSICISLFRRDPFVLAKIKEVGQENCCVSEMTLAELSYGAWKSANPKHFDDVANIERAFEILPVYPAIDTYGKIKAQLEQIGQRVDEIDLFIGATASFNHCIMVTHNEKHFTPHPASAGGELESMIASKLCGFYHFRL
jgi:tRNA(fMet)-specific endonuclease VapC